mgnify:CR=1 FL=1
MEPVGGTYALYDVLTCEKKLHIIERSGYLVHLDYGKDEAFALLLDWFQRRLRFAG